MTENEILKELHKETMYFFDNIFTSNELQLKYDLINYTNRDFVFHIIKDFKESPTACIIKPFYEKTYADSSVTRCLTVRRDKYGFLTTQLNLPNSEPSIIEPFRFVSIIKQLIEDENIKREMYSEKENEAVNENEFSR